MTGETNRLVEEGERALLAGDWVGARDAFRIALREAETPEAFNGLGEALWWLGATQDSISARERAYAGFRRGQDQAHNQGGVSSGVPTSAPEASASSVAPSRHGGTWT